MVKCNCTQDKMLYYITLINFKASEVKVNVKGEFKSIVCADLEM